MSDTKKIEPVEMELIREDAQIVLTVPASLYGRLQDLLFGGFHFKDHEELNQTLKKITEGNIGDDTRAYHLETVLCFIKDLEDAAKTQGFTFKTKVDPENRKIVSD